MTVIHVTRIRKGYNCDGAAPMVAEMGNGNYSECIRVVYDPDDDGGFSPGALIPKLQAMNMLNLCHWTDGTRVHVPGYGELVVETYTHCFNRNYSAPRQAFRGPGYRLIAPPDPCGRALIRKAVIA